MESSLRLFLVLITLSIVSIVLHAQNQQGFISLDCGLPANEQSPYKRISGLSFSSDDKFIQSGEAARVKENPMGFIKPYDTLRYFPEGIRNCYNLGVEKGRLYLIRASFVYGNYDGLDTKPVFDLYLGPNLWTKIDLGRDVNGTRKDILHSTTSNSLMICLVKTDTTKPLISSLELRPMGNGSYITEAGSLELYYLYYLSKSRSQIRYGKDVYDRIWEPYFQTEWTNISTTLPLDHSTNASAPPKEALRFAATPTNASAPLTINWTSRYFDDQFYYYAHFSEIQDLQANETREFNLLWNGVKTYGPLVPRKLGLSTIFNTQPKICDNGECSFQLTRTSNSTLPPLLNAFELYRVIQFPQSETEESDVDAIKNIAATYGLSRINWQGDPCVPELLRWDGLNCSNTSMSPRITTLNLSSSGLSGTLAAAIQSLTQLENLDLSSNNLTGEVPEFLGNMKSLVVINLTGNDLSGSIPQALRKTGVKLIVEGNSRLCLTDSCRKPPKKKTFVPIVASVASAAIVMVVLVLFLVLRKKKSPIVEDLQLQPRTSLLNATFANSPQPSFDQKNKRFTYSEIIKMTNNFQRVLGKGGFGVVFHGTLNGFEQVAVKVLSELSTHGYKQFIAEVDLLLRVHHTNLVSLVGYCYEGDHLALVYEFLSNGNLQQHLRGNLIIDWGSRLRIALEVALGLEYLHSGCSPTMVHRDVKTTNILLDEYFKAKLADFGLSKSFPVGGQSHESSMIGGTPGYIDPEYHRSGRLDEKSDVYSFGIVLLEMMTNHPVISRKCHITQWVGFKLERGDIEGIMDVNLFGVYDTNSAWRALEIAMSCVDPLPANRPTMSHVINELKECLSKNRSLEAQEMNMSSDTSIVPVAR